MKQVTINLGPNLLRHVEGIPDDELPNIIEDLLEKSLAEQVQNVCTSEPAVEAEAEKKLMSKIGGWLSAFIQNNSSGSTGDLGVPTMIQMQDTSVLGEKKEIELTVIKDEYELSDDDADLMELMK